MNPDLDPVEMQYLARLVKADIDDKGTKAAVSTESAKKVRLRFMEGIYRKLIRASR